VIVCPQLSTAGPQTFPLQVVDVGCDVHPQPLGPAPPPPHVFGGVHVPHVTVCMQLLAVGPQAFPLQAVTLSGLQHV
jgi:hypothetical protein